MLVEQNSFKFYCSFLGIKLTGWIGSDNGAIIEKSHISCSEPYFKIIHILEFTLPKEEINQRDLRIKIKCNRHYVKFNKMNKYITKPVTFFYLRGLRSLKRIIKILLKLIQSCVKDLM